MQANDTCTVFVRCVEGIEDIRLQVPKNCAIEKLKQQIKDQLPPQILSRMNISSVGGFNISRYSTVEELYNFITTGTSDDIPMFLNLKINICLCGGKGGFGQLLKARGHQLNKKNRKSQKSNSKDLYKTLDGRRVKSIKRLKKLEDYMNTLDETEKSKLMEKRSKLQKILDVDLQKNVKFEDNDFLDEIDKQIEEIRVGVMMDLSSSGQSDSSDCESESDPSDSEDEDKPSTSKKEEASPRRHKFLSFFDNDNNDNKDPETRKKAKEDDV